MRDKFRVGDELNSQIQWVIDLARIVTVMDGTDRQSLDDLREALYQLGKLKLELEKLLEDEEPF